MKNIFRDRIKIFIDVFFILFTFLSAKQYILAGNSLNIIISERASVKRINEYVNFGIPIPIDWNAKNISEFRLRDDKGDTIDGQFEILARWGSSPDNPSAPIKWILAGCLQTIDANCTKTLTLDLATSQTSPKQIIKANDSSLEKMYIDTGKAIFEICKDGNFNIINQVTINDKKLLTPLQHQDAISYEPIGNLSVVGNQTLDYSIRTTSTTLEMIGPLYAVVKATGSIIYEKSKAILDFTARLHFYAYSSDVRVDFTVENNFPIIEGEWEQPVNVHDLGAINSVYIGNLRLKLKIANPEHVLHVQAEDNVDISSPTSEIKVYQDSSGTDNWNAYVGMVGWPGYEALAQPRLQSYCTIPGFQISGNDLATTKTGSQSEGWMTIYREDPTQYTITVAVKDFWQNFPKALETYPDGTISINLFPNGERFRHNFRVGEEKTHSIMLSFRLNENSSQQSKNIAAAFNKPLIGKVSPSCYTNSKVLGRIAEYNLNRWRLYERFVRIAFEPNPDFDPNVDDPNFGNSTLLNAIKRYNFYGWQDYGDVPLDYEAFGENQAGQMNLKYWFTYGMLQQYCRSGDYNWLDLALPAARHISDIDILHIPDEGIQHWAHGAYFGHSQHDEPGNSNPNRNYNSPSIDLSFGAPDLLLAYYLTGEKRFREVAFETIEAMINMSQFSDFTDPVFQRERANMIFALIEGYKQTGNIGWLNKLKEIVNHTADLSNKGWVTNPQAYGLAHPDSYIGMFQFDQVVWALGKYVDFCEEYNFTDCINVKNAIIAFGNFVINFVMREYTPGRAAHPHEYNFAAPDFSDPDINNWALVMADALTYAYKYSKDKRFLDAAAKFYTTGTVDPVWRDDPPVYLATKDLVNSCNWGLVYMQEVLQSSGETNFWALY